MVWGNDGDDYIVWGRAVVDDNIVWGTGGDDNIVWGTGNDDNIVWGTSGLDNIVWGTSAESDATWGNSGEDQVSFVEDEASEPVPNLALEFGESALTPTVEPADATNLVTVGGI